MTSLANLENELNDKLDAPSMEDQQAKHKKDIEKAITDRILVMREIVVRTSALNLSRFSNPFLHRKSRDDLRPSNKR